MNLTQLEYLCTAVDLGGVTRAAERLCVSQQAVSKAIKALEAELGEELLSRGPDGVVPTAACRRVLPHARAAVRETELLARATRGLGRPRTLRLAVPEAVVGDEFIVGAEELLAYEASAPGVTLEVVEDEVARCADMVVSGAADMAVVGGRPDFDRFSCMRLCASPARAFVGLGHPLACAGGPVPIEALGSQRLLVPRGARMSMAEIQDAFYLSGAPVPGPGQFVFPECTAHMLMEHVYRGEGVAFVDERVLGLVDTSRARVLQVEGEPFTMSLNAVWAPGREDPLLDGLRAHLAGLLGN